MNEDTTTAGTTKDQPEQILLVDDNPTNLQVLYETLDSGANYQRLSQEGQPRDQGV